MRSANSEQPTDASAGGAGQGEEAEAARETTSSFGIWPWVELARRNNMPIEQFCRLAGVKLAAVRDPGARFSQRASNRVADLAFEHFGADAAMAATLTVEAGHFNLVELVARSACTVGDGLATVCRFFPLLHSGARLTEEVAADGSHALRWWPIPTFEVHHGYVELAFGVALRGIRRETGDEAVTPREVWFRHAGPAGSKLHAQVLGGSVRFGMPHDCMVLDADAVALRLKRHNGEIHAAAADVAADLIAQD
jgi:hypothetical protein